jgi:hypothetical protein
MSELLLDRAGRRRSPATMPGFHAGHAPGNKGLRYPADPPKVEEIIAVMRAAGDGTHGRPPTRTHRDYVASRARHPGGSRSRRGRSRSTPWLTPGPARQGRAPSRGRHGRITSVYLQGIDSGEIIETVHARRAPMIPVSASLRL